MWNPKTGTCLRSAAGAGYGLCVVVVPGNRHALIGTKAGALVVLDVAAGAVSRTLPAHSGPCWSIALSPDGEGFATGGADKARGAASLRGACCGADWRRLGRAPLARRQEVKFWEFTLAPPEGEDEGGACHPPRVRHTRGRCCGAVGEEGGRAIHTGT